MIDADVKAMSVPGTAAVGFLKNCARYRDHNVNGK